MQLVSYEELKSMDAKEIRELGKSWEMNLPPALGEEKLREAVYIESLKRAERMKARAQAELAQEARDKLEIGNEVGARALPEDVAILASKRWYVRFTNLEQPRDDISKGATVDFVKGTHKFSLYDDQIHCLPGVFLAQDIEQVKPVYDAVVNFYVSTGMPKQDKGRVLGAESVAKGVMARLSLMGHMHLSKEHSQVATSGTFPVFSDVQLPSGERISRLTATQPRWLFERISEAAPDTPFGLVSDVKELEDARRSELVPLG